MTSRSVLRNATVYFGANVLNAGIPFFLLPILTRLLTPGDYGILSMFAVVLTVSGAFTGLSVHGAVAVRFFQLDKDKLAEYVGCCIGILVCSTALTLIVVLALGSPLARVTSVPAEWILLAVAAASLQVLTAIRLSVWQAAGRALSFAAFQVAQSALNVGLSLLLVFVGLAWHGRVLGQATAIAAFGLLALALLFSDGLVRKPTSWRAPSRDALNFGVPLIPHVLGGLAISSGGQFVVTNMYGVAATGPYVVAAQLGAAMGLISDAFVKTYGPWLYKRLAEQPAASRHLVVGVTYSVFLAFVLVSSLVSAAVYAVFPFVVGEEFARARAITPLFVFANGFVGMYYAVAGFFFFSSKTRYVSLVTIVSGISSILIMWLLGRSFGLMGVAIGYLIANAMMFMLAWLLSNRTLPMPWLQIRAAVASLTNSKVPK